MPYEEIKKVQQRPHSLTLEGREKMSITGVDDVSGFDENTIVLTTSQGDLNIHGQGLHIDRIDLDAGELELRGKIQLRRACPLRLAVVKAVRLRWRSALACRPSGCCWPCSWA